MATVKMFTRTATVDEAAIVENYCESLPSTSYESAVTLPASAAACVDTVFRPARVMPQTVETTEAVATVIIENENAGELHENTVRISANQVGSHSLNAGEKGGQRARESSANASAKFAQRAARLVCPALADVRAKAQNLAAKVLPANAKASARLDTASKESLSTGPADRDTSDPVKRNQTSVKLGIVKEPGLRSTVKEPGSRSPVKASGSRNPVKKPDSRSLVKTSGSRNPVKEPGSGKKLTINLDHSSTKQPLKRSFWAIIRGGISASAAREDLHNRGAPVKQVPVVVMTNVCTPETASNTIEFEPQPGAQSRNHLSFHNDSLKATKSLEAQPKTVDSTKFDKDSFSQSQPITPTVTVRDEIHEYNTPDERHMDFLRIDYQCEQISGSSQLSLGASAITPTMESSSGALSWLSSSRASQATSDYASSVGHGHLADSSGGKANENAKANGLQDLIRGRQDRRASINNELRRFSGSVESENVLKNFLDSLRGDAQRERDENNAKRGEFSGPAISPDLNANANSAHCTPTLSQDLGVASKRPYANSECSAATNVSQIRPETIGKLLALASPHNAHLDASTFNELLRTALLQVSVDTMAITALPLDCWLKERLKNWVQLSGHAGTIVPASNHTLWKKLPQQNTTEAKAYARITADSALTGLTPKFYKEIVHKNESFIEIQDLLAQFPDTASRAIMDIKIGVRTFMESEVSNTTKRADLYKKMVDIAPEEPTEEEHADRAITKLRYMQFRERESSTALLGFRIEAAQLPGGKLQKNFKRVQTKQQVLETLVYFFGESHAEICTQLAQRLRQIRDGIQKSEFFRTHEVVGSSILIIYDKTKTGAWMIDFAKSTTVPEPMILNHRVPWVLGNHEDGYLIGLENLIEILEMDEKQSRRTLPASVLTTVNK